MSHPAARARGPLRTIDIWLRPDATIGVGIWGPDGLGPFTRLGHRVLDGRHLTTPDAVLEGACEALRLLGWSHEAIVQAARSLCEALPAQSPQPALSTQQQDGQAPDGGRPRPLV